MKYIKENKDLLKKYITILIFNLIAYIICNFYFNSSDTGYIVMLLVVFLFNLIVYTYNDKVIFKYHLDLLLNFLVGFILLLFVKNINIYVIVIFSLFLGNNIVFMKSRISDKFLLRSIQYALIFLLTLLSTSINLILFYLIY